MRQQAPAARSSSSLSWSVGPASRRCRKVVSWRPDGPACVALHVAQAWARISCTHSATSPTVAETLVLQSHAPFRRGDHVVDAVSHLLGYPVALHWASVHIPLLRVNPASSVASLVRDLSLLGHRPAQHAMFCDITQYLCRGNTIVAALGCGARPSQALVPAPLHVPLRSRFKELVLRHSVCRVAVVR